MRRPRMRGREWTEEEIEEYKDESNISNIAYRKEKTVNVPTTQVGYYDDGTIKEVEIRPAIYELDKE